MKFLTKQEIFNKVRDHLLKQGKRAMRGSRGCAYRTPTGLKCAAGCLILDEFYRPEFEGLLAQSEAVKNALIESGVNTNNETTLSLVQRLQDIHDDGALNPKKDWPGALTKVAHSFKLKETP